MKSKIKKLTKALLGESLYYKLVNFKVNSIYRAGRKSFSQEGEDLVLSSLLFKLNGGKHNNDGFYVDIGAHHPYRYSNTFLFYKQGWSGLNVDAMPGSMKAFNKSRSRDVNLECGVGQHSDSVKFYIFNEPALNTFDENLAMSRCNADWHIRTTVSIPIIPLSTILQKYVIPGRKIDFLTIDVEGFDLDVLKSNDWNRYRPSVVLAETFGLSFESLADDSIYDYMHSLNYIIYSKTINTTFFVDGNLL